MCNVDEIPCAHQSLLKLRLFRILVDVYHCFGRAKRADVAHPITLCRF
jgi:hypothetical protein